MGGILVSLHIITTVDSSAYITSTPPNKMVTPLGRLVGSCTRVSKELLNFLPPCNMLCKIQRNQSTWLGRPSHKRAPPNETNSTQGFVTMADLTALLDREHSRQSSATFQFIHDPPYPKDILSKPYPKNYERPTFSQYDGRKGNGVEHVNKFLDALGAHVGDAYMSFLNLSPIELTLALMPLHGLLAMHLQRSASSIIFLAQYCCIFKAAGDASSSCQPCRSQPCRTCLCQAKGVTFICLTIAQRFMKAFSIITFLALLPMSSLSLNLARTEKHVFPDTIFPKLMIFFTMRMAGSSTFISSSLGMDSFKVVAKYGMPFSGIAFYANFDIRYAIIFIFTLMVGFMVTS
ncbi:hypothetical protein SLEP1_g24479 [Rubroshorea leprosula]|uniref:Uncharacterized protein n=1 Tax=Rubroshorea leprosula TaxID=152421 RepID=A0AAV5JQC3_9ROSI|nr:hypothetical protein SLEP1_g24479 [Rubroshorea leprosula]